MIEFYSPKYDTTFMVDSDTLYTLCEDEWEPVEWDIISEDKEVYEDYLNFLTK